MTMSYVNRSVFINKLKEDEVVEWHFVEAQTVHTDTGEEMLLRQKYNHP
jgi:hypothetical protein